MKTYRLENWDLLGCPDNDDLRHLGGQIYGHPEVPDGTWVMTDHIIFFDNEEGAVVTYSSCKMRLGEMSDLLKKKQKDAIATLGKNSKDITVGGKNLFNRILQDHFTPYDPSEWTARGHTELNETQGKLNDLLNKIFGRPGAADSSTKH